MKNMINVKAVIICGSGERAMEFADHWSEKGKHKILKLKKEDRFVFRYCNQVIFASHGMGMPSASIALQELMKIIYFLKRGNLEEIDKVFWARVGTSGGVGLKGGSVILSTYSLMADLKPYRLLIGEREQYFNPEFPIETAQAIKDANKNTDFELVMGKTVAANEFFIEQFRLDGAICLIEESWKTGWLKWIYENGVRNIEMEGAMFAGYMNHWGFSNFSMICCSLLDRFNGDQITSTPDELKQFSNNSGAVLFKYLNKFINNK
jgi:uridine phosphorylase